MWIIGSIIGSLSLVILNVCSKLIRLNWQGITVVCLLSLVATWAFTYAWRTSPKSFIAVWFLQSAMVSTGAFLANEVLVHDPIEPVHVVGVMMIFVGALLLK